MLLYGSEVFLQVKEDKDEPLQEYLKQAVSSSSKNYGKLFSEVVEEVKGDFYKIDPGFFAPAKMTINNMQTGSLFSAGAINPKMLEKSIQTS